MSRIGGLGGRALLVVTVGCVGAWSAVGTPRASVAAAAGKRALLLDEPDRAAALYRAAAGQALSPASRIDRARALVTTGRIDAAMRSLTRAARDGSPDVEVVARTTLAKLHLAGREPSNTVPGRQAEIAMGEARRALLLRPGHEPAIRVMLEAARRLEGRKPAGHESPHRREGAGSPRGDRGSGGQTGGSRERDGGAMDELRARALVRSVAVAGTGAVDDLLESLLGPEGRGPASMAGEEGTPW